MPKDLLLLAAGAGRRMKHLSSDRPKALVVVDGERSILEINVDNACAVIPDLRITLCGGYRFEQIADFAERRSGTAPIQAVFNPAFLTEGPLRSIKVGLDAIDPEATSVIIGNGDTVFSPEVMRVAAGLDPARAALVVSHEPAPEPDDMLVKLDADGRILSVIKDLGHAGPSLLSAGFLIVNGREAVTALRASLDRTMRTEEQSGSMLPWHSLVADFCNAPVGLHPVLVDRHCWHEFDSPECIERFQASPAARTARGPVADRQEIDAA